MVANNVPWRVCRISFELITSVGEFNEFFTSTERGSLWLYWNPTDCWPPGLCSMMLMCAESGASSSTLWEIRLLPELMANFWNMIWKLCSMTTLLLYIIKQKLSARSWTLISFKLKCRANKLWKPCSCLGTNKASHSHTFTECSILTGSWIKFMRILPGKITWKKNLPFHLAFTWGPRQNSLKTHVNSALNILQLNSKSQYWDSQMLSPHYDAKLLI